MVAAMSYAMEGDRERILGFDCDGYIPEPMTINGFLETVARRIVYGASHLFWPVPWGLDAPGVKCHIRALGR